MVLNCLIKWLSHSCRLSRRSNFRFFLRCGDVSSFEYWIWGRAENITISIETVMFDMNSIYNGMISFKDHQKKRTTTDPKVQKNEPLTGRGCGVSGRSLSPLLLRRGLRGLLVAGWAAAESCCYQVMTDHFFPERDLWDERWRDEETCGWSTGVFLLRLNVEWLCHICVLFAVWLNVCNTTRLF